MKRLIALVLLGSTLAGCPAAGGGNTQPAPAETPAASQRPPAATGGAGRTPPSAYQPDARAVAAIEEARALFHELDYTQALAKVDAALKLDPRYPQAYLLQGRIHHGRSDYEVAIASYGRAIELDASLVEAWEARGLSRYWLQDLEGAVTDFTRTIELDDAHFSAFKNRGSARGELKQYGAALEDLRRALELVPEGDEEQLEQVESLIARVEELQTYSESEQRRRDRMEALQGEGGVDGEAPPASDDEGSDGGE